MEQAQTNTISKAEYARRKGVNRSTITRWADNRRVLLDVDGNVLVAESEELLAKTADPSRAGVVDRHQRERGQGVIDLTTDAPAVSDRPEASVKRGDKNEHYSKRVEESARREAAEADLAEMRRDREIGRLTDVEGVQKAMVDFAAETRKTFEGLVPELKLRLAIETDPDKIGALLLDALRGAARKISDMASAQADLATSTKQ